MSVVIRFSVMDTGVGIPREKQEMVFSRFTQADMSTTRLFGGTGLGLAICKELVHLFHGEIDLVSEEGKGSQFPFTAVFERSRNEPQNEGRQSTAPAGNNRNLATPQTSGEGTGKSLRILVAEDNRVNSRVAIHLLKSLGHVAEAVYNGRETVDALRQIAYDIVLMDCQDAGHGWA